MHELQIFENPDFGTIRAIEKDGAPWFVAADVCRALGLEQVTRAMDRLDDDERGLVKVTHPQSPAKTMDMNAVNEPGLYHLVLCSNKPEAKAFKRWITHDVLPSIRKHGGYIAGQEIMSPEELLARALVVANSIIEETKTKLKEAESNIHMLSIINRQQQPMVDYFMACVDRNNLTSLRETAKLLHVKEKKLVAFLLDNKYLYRSPSGKLLPHGGRSENLFEVKEAHDKKRKWFGVQTFVNPRGRETLRLLLSGKSESGMWGEPYIYPTLPASEIPDMTEGEAYRLEEFYLKQARRQEK